MHAWLTFDVHLCEELCHLFDVWRCVIRTTQQHSAAPGGSSNSYLSCSETREGSCCQDIALLKQQGAQHAYYHTHTPVLQTDMHRSTLCSYMQNFCGFVVMIDKGLLHTHLMLPACEEHLNPSGCWTGQEHKAVERTQAYLDREDLCRM